MLIVLVLFVQIFRFLPPLIIPYTLVFYCPEFSGQEIHSTVILNPVEQSSVALEDEEDSELKGPVVRTVCLLLIDCCM